jgi:hypothetical protein
MRGDDSRYLHSIVTAFIQVESMQDTSGYSAAIERLSKDSGLDSLPINTILRLKSILSDYRQSKKKQHGK